jgi:hypothetical protein
MEANYRASSIKVTSPNLNFVNIPFFIGYIVLSIIQPEIWAKMRLRKLLVLNAETRLMQGRATQPLLISTLQIAGLIFQKGPHHLLHFGDHLYLPSSQYLSCLMNNLR